MGKEGFEPSRLAALDSKSRSSADSDTSPCDSLGEVAHFQSSYNNILAFLPQFDLAANSGN